MASIIIPQIYPKWNTIRPMNLQNVACIPYNALNSLQYYDEIRKIAYECYVDIIFMGKIITLIKKMLWLASLPNISKGIF